jgi:hypothetical protein
VLRPVGSGAKSGFVFVDREFSVNNHPVVADLVTFVESCRPDIELTVNDMPTEKHMNVLKAKLGLYDSFYVEYLLSICTVMGLLEKSASIYSNRAHVTSQYDELMSLSPTDIFAKVVDASLKAASAFLTEMIPLPEPYFTPEVILDLLKAPVPIEQLFQQVYSILGIKMQDVYSYDELDDFDPFIDDLNNAVISSTFLLGLLVDKCILTPFGYYLQLISPLYTLPFDFESEMLYLLDSFEEDEGPVTALYAPSAFYYLTPLGREFFDVDPSPKRELISDKMPLDELCDKLFTRTHHDWEILRELFTILEESGRKIFVLKAKFAGNKTLWKNIELPGNVSLRFLAAEIAYEFCIEPAEDYSFFTDLTQNPFNQYSSIKAPKRGNKDPDIHLADLRFEEKHKFMLVIYNSTHPFSLVDKPNKKTEIELEVLKIKPRTPGMPYPLVSRTSAAVRAIEESIFNQ